MNIDGFTYKVQDAIAVAGQAANEYKHTEITVLHLWKALLSEEDGLLISLYNRLGLKTNELKSYIDKLLNETPAVSGEGATYGQYVSQDFNKLFQEAEKTKSKLGDEYLSVEHLALSLFEQKHHPLTAYLVKRNITPDKLSIIIEEIRGGEKVTSQNPEAKYEAIKKIWQ